MPHFSLGPALAVLALLGLGGLAGAPASAQDAPPRLPAAPQPLPGPAAGPVGTFAAENFLVTSAANERGAYLWIVAPVQRFVILCEKPETAKDFSCITKRLP